MTRNRAKYSDYKTYIYKMTIYQIVHLKRRLTEETVLDK